MKRENTQSVLLIYLTISLRFMPIITDKPLYMATCAVYREFFTFFTEFYVHTNTVLQGWEDAMFGK